MKIKAVLSDFDGTIVTKDILDVVCGIVGKEEESRRINKEFLAGEIKGHLSLITRVNFLKGVTTKQIYQKLFANDYLRFGAKELFDFLNSKSIISILYSGNITPVLKYYQRKLGISHIVGAKPKMDGDKIVSIAEDDFSGASHKLINIRKILDQYNINFDEVVAIGDSPADKMIFEFAAKSIAVDPKEGIKKYSDFIIKGDLSEAVNIIKSLLKSKL